jgi:hypothetical protein
LSVQEVVGNVNQKNSKIPTLWAIVTDLSADFVDADTGRSQHVDGGGSLVYTSPDSIRMQAKNTLYDLFDMGCNGDECWLWLKHIDRVYTGKLAAMAKSSSKEIPIRPDLVLEVLGIRPIDPDLLKEPVPVMTFDGELDAYKMVWQARSADHWIVQKEIWYDRATLEPRQVSLFGADGREVLRAKLSKPAAVEDANVGQDQWPQTPSRFELYFPQTGSKMSFELSQMRLSFKGFPKPASYRMPVWTPEEKVIEIDEHPAP